MTFTPSAILDPVTGLPLDQYSGIIQQIPLGQQVFPLADLNADGRMMRQPIYGDDVIPTSALVVGQDSSGQPRAGTMDTSRRLWTREAVFQSNGAAIADGTTAPVDVNVVSGGGGGGGGSPISIVPYDLSQSTGGFGSGDLGPIGLLGSTIYGIVFSWTYDAGSIRSTGHNAYVRVTIPVGHGGDSNFYLASIAISIPASGTTDRIAGEVNNWFWPGIKFPAAYDNGDGHYHIWLDETNIGGGNLTLEIWQDA